MIMFDYTEKLDFFFPPYPVFSQRPAGPFAFAK